MEPLNQSIYRNWSNKFSIIITTYNRLSLLKRALNSALNQTINCELIVVDDASNDGTEDYLHSLNYSVIVIHNQKRLGHSASINLAVQAARGAWIKILDDDDYLASNCIEEMCGAIARYPQAVICSCQAAQVTLEGRQLSLTPPVGLGKVVSISQEDIHYGMLLELLPFGTPVQVAFRQDAFLQSGGWNSSLDYAYDDIDSWLRIAQLGDGIFINQCLAYRTVWPGSYNQKFSLEKRLEINFKIKEKIYALVNKKYQNVIPPISDVRHYLQLYWGLVALKQKKFVDFFKIAFPSILSIRAWKLLVNAVFSRKGF